MPDRILRAAILTSDRVNVLGWQAEVFYRRLMSVVDDFGRYDGRPAILLSQLFPLRLSRVSESDIGKWMRETAEAGLVRFYQVDGRDYLQLEDFRQRLRSETSKFPAPPSNDSECPPVARTRGHPQPYSYAHAESYSESETNAQKADSGGLSFLDQVSRLYEAYPQHVGKKAAVVAIGKALKKKDFDFLYAAVLEFAASPVGQGEFCPNPATWFNQERWDDDRSAWQRGSNSGRAGPRDVSGGRGANFQPGDVEAGGKVDF